MLTSSHAAGEHEELELLVQPESYYIIGIAGMWWVSSCDLRVVMDGYRLFCKDREEGEKELCSVLMSTLNV